MPADGPAEPAAAQNTASADEPCDEPPPPLLLSPPPSPSSSAAHEEPMSPGQRCAARSPQALLAGRNGFCAMAFFVHANSAVLGCVSGWMPRIALTVAPTVCRMKSVTMMGALRKLEPDQQVRSDIPLPLLALPLPFRQRMMPLLAVLQRQIWLLIAARTASGCAMSMLSAGASNDLLLR